MHPKSWAIALRLDRDWPSRPLTPLAKAAVVVVLKVFRCRLFAAHKEIRRISSPPIARSWTIRNRVPQKRCNIIRRLYKKIIRNIYEYMRILCKVDYNPIRSLC